MRVLNTARTLLPSQDRHLALVTRVGVLESLRHHKHVFNELAPAVELARRHDPPFYTGRLGTLPHPGQSVQGDAMHERLLKLYTAAGELEMQEIRTEQAKAALAQALREAIAAEIEPDIAAKAAGMTVQEIFKVIRSSPSSTQEPRLEEGEMNWL